MKEFSDLQNECLQRIVSHKKCESNCYNNHFCINNGCKESDCSNCMNNILHNPTPKIHYICKRITYYYVLRFFNRFASEISYLVDYLLPYIKKKTDLYIVSLGCGPGSEIYGFLKSLKDKYPNITLHYEGHDLEKCWETVQGISKNSLANLNHDINFYSTDIFLDFHGFGNNHIDCLILNYVLSDAIKYLTNVQKTKFINDIVDFVLKNNVRNILFNDICFYGNQSSLNSGVQLMKLFISQLKERNKSIKEYYLKFDKIMSFGNENWFQHRTQKIKFTNIKNNNYMKNADYCNSKQIYVHII